MTNLTPSTRHEANWFIGYSPRRLRKIRITPVEAHWIQHKPETAPVVKQIGDSWLIDRDFFTNLGLTYPGKDKQNAN